jgi:hypothetical protein
MYSLSVAAAARLRFVNGNRSLDRFGTMTSLDWLFHKATRLLREYFSSVEDEDDIDPQALIDVMDMFRVSYYAQRGSAAKVCRCWGRRYSGLNFPLGMEPVRCPCCYWCWISHFAPAVFIATTLNDVGKVPVTLREKPEDFDHLISIGFQEIRRSISVLRTAGFCPFGWL